MARDLQGRVAGRWPGSYSKGFGEPFAEGFREPFAEPFGIESNCQISQLDGQHRTRTRFAKQSSGCDGSEGGSMGASNVMTAYLRWSHLPDRAFRALVYMALVSMDTDKEPRYYAGREALIVNGLGRQLPPQPAASDTSVRANEFRKVRAADYQAAKVVVSQLVKAGAIVLDTAPARKRSAEYVLTLDSPTGYVSPTERGTSNVPPRRDPPTGDPLTEEQLGTLEETRSGISVNSPVNSAVYKNAKDFLSTLPDLGVQYLNRVPDELSPSQRVIAAAGLARSEAS